MALSLLSTTQIKSGVAVVKLLSTTSEKYVVMANFKIEVLHSVAVVEPKFMNQTVNFAATTNCLIVHLELILLAVAILLSMLQPVYAVEALQRPEMVP